MAKRKGKPRKVPLIADSNALAPIERVDSMVLADPRDRKAFVAAILKTRAPSGTLKAAAARYRASTKNRRNQV